MRKLVCWVFIPSAMVSRVMIYVLFFCPGEMFVNISGWGSGMEKQLHTEDVSPVTGQSSLTFGCKPFRCAGQDISLGQKHII